MSPPAPPRRPALSVVVPVYNSEGTIGRLVERAVAELTPLYPDLEIVLVNDGSRDRSHEVILGLLAGPCGPHVRYVELTRNFGEHNAVLCGLQHCRGEAAVIVDDDFQNPLEDIPKLVAGLAEGHDVVYSYYGKKQHSWFRNLGSRFNDRVASVLLQKPRGLYLSSFKALNRFTIDSIRDYEGPYPYVDGLILRSTRLIGTRLCSHRPRLEGASNYTFRKLVSLWLNMFTSYSLSPLRIAAYLGLAMSVLGFLLAIFFVVSWSVGGILADELPRGWASLIVTLTFFSGIQLLVLGLMGEYVGRIFMTQNKQPQVVVRQVWEADGRPR